MNKELGEKVQVKTKELTNTINKLQDLISEHKKTEQELNIFKKIFDTTSEAIAISDPDGRLIYINPAHENLFGYSLEEAKNLNYRDYYPPKSKEILNKIVAPALVQGKSWEGELDVYNTEGKIFPLWEQANSVLDNDGRMIYAFGIMHDISERKKLENDLLALNTELEDRVEAKTKELNDTIKKLEQLIIEHKIAKERLRESQQNLKERVKELSCLYELTKLVEKSSDSIENIFQGTLDLIPPAWQFPAMICVKIIYDNLEFKTSNFKKTKWGISTTIIVNKKRLKIELFYLEERPFLKEEEYLISEIGHRLKVIIEQKEAEQKLKESEEKYRSLVENVTDIIVEFDMNGYFLYVSPQVHSIAGYHPKEVIGTNGFNLIHPDDLKQAKLILKNVKRTRKNVYGEFRVLHKKGHYFYVSASGRVVIRDGVPKSIVVIKDITDKKIAEQQIKESEEKFKSIFKGGLIPTYTWQKVLNDLILIDYNDAAEKITQGSIKNFIGIEASEMYRDRPKILKELNN